MQQKKHPSFIIYDHHGMGTTNLDFIDSTVWTTPPIPTHAVYIAAVSVAVAGTRVSSLSLVGTNEGRGALCTLAAPAARVTAAAAKRGNTQDEEGIHHHVLRTFWEISTQSFRVPN